VPKEENITGEKIVTRHEMKRDHTAKSTLPFLIASLLSLASSMVTVLVIRPFEPRMAFEMSWTLWSIYVEMCASLGCVLAYFRLFDFHFARLMLSGALTTCCGATVAFWSMSSFFPGGLIQATADRNLTMLWIEHWHHTTPTVLLAGMAYLSRHRSFCPIPLSAMRTIFPLTMCVPLPHMAVLVFLRWTGKINWFPYPVFDIVGEMWWGWIALVGAYTVLTLVISLLVSRILGGSGDHENDAGDLTQSKNK
jgi:hypothetical protein